MGGSYAGMLSAWMRLKYPHVVLGALASSAPILYFDGLTPEDAYDKVVSKEYKEISENCYLSIKQSWAKIDEVAVEKNGLAVLSKQFHTCSKLNSSSELKNALEHIYDAAAQNGAFSIEKFCKIVDEASHDSNLLDNIYSGLAAADAIWKKCLPSEDYFLSKDTTDGWSWQSCIDMVMPMGRGNDTIYYPRPFNWTDFNLSCKMIYGVPPRPHWATTYYGGQDIKLVLRRFASNIIFSNVLKDPYSSGGVLEDISDTLVAITAKKGRHCFDLLPMPSGSPKWMLKVRVKEVKIIRSWLDKYYRDLKG
ncbi:unnamed protein product [Rhodiola kirilowii]